MSSWSSQGVIAWLEGGDIWVLPPDGTPAPFFASEVSERYATFSPDGQWLAYVSGNEVYVRPYPGPDPATLIANGGAEPAWSPDGRQIYYATQGGAFMAVDVTPGEEFQAGRPALLMDPPGYLGNNPVRGYDVFPDGSFVIALDEDEGTLVEQFGATELHVVLNFFE